MEGKFPRIWKRALITPVFKGGKRSDCSSYRPISILPILGKILERIVHDQLSAFLTRTLQLSDMQCGFKKNNSTSTCLMKMLSDWRMEADVGKVTAVIALDLTKAFDCLPHDILMTRLRDLGLSPLAIDWFEDYLHERFQSVRFQTDCSTFLQYMVGVPQGSVLGPLLFNVFIDPLLEVVKYSKAILFADDTTLYYSDFDLERIRSRLEWDLDRVSCWMTQNGLQINPLKTKLMVVGTKKMRLKVGVDDLFVDCGGHRICPVEQMKILGVWVDGLLTWKHHVTSVFKKTMNLNRILLRLRNLVPTSILILIFKSLILPHITYCDIVWMDCNKFLSSKIQVIGNTAARYIVSGHGPSSASLANSILNWMPLSSLRDMHLYVQLWKILNLGQPQYLRDLMLFQSSTHLYSTRLRTDMGLCVRQFRTKFGAESFVGRGPRYWNGLPGKIRLITNIVEFKKEILKYLSV